MYFLRFLRQSFTSFTPQCFLPTIILLPQKKYSKCIAVPLIPQVYSTLIDT